MKISTLIKKLEQLRYEHFQLVKMGMPSGEVPDDADVCIEYWDKEGFHGLTKDFDVIININENIEISPNG